MGTIAETPIVDYRLSFPNLGQQTSFFRFRLQQKKKRKPSISIFRFPSDHFPLWNFGNMKLGDIEGGDMEKWRHGGMEMETWT